MAASALAPPSLSQSAGKSERALRGLLLLARRPERRRVPSNAVGLSSKYSNVTPEDGRHERVISLTISADADVKRRSV